MASLARDLIPLESSPVRQGERHP